MRDYRSSMNLHILPNFGNRPICEITASDVEDFVRTLTCSPKRINNILVPVRSLFKLAKKKGYVSENIMLDVDNLKEEVFMLQARAKPPSASPSDGVGTCWHYALVARRPRLR